MRRFPYVPSLFGVRPKSASWMAAAMSARIVGSYDSTKSAVALREAHNNTQQPKTAPMKRRDRERGTERERGW